MKKTDKRTGKVLKILIDTGATYNYVKPGLLHNKRILENKCRVKSIHGESIIDSYQRVNMLQTCLDFYELKDLSEYDAIMGMAALSQIHGKIDISKCRLFHEFGEEILYFNESSEVNMLVNVNKEISVETKGQLERILNKYQGAYSEDPDYIPYNTNIKCKIETTTKEPIFSKSHTLPLSTLDFINGEINSLLKNGVIRQSFSPYNSPVWVVDKKGVDENGKPKHRMVIDYRKLNSFTITDKYPIPETSVILSNLGKAKFFSTLDLQAGFHQILIGKDDVPKTAFSINNGKYEFLRMPFGLKNAPSVFQRAIDNILRPFIGKFCHVYIDDVIVYSKDEKEHLNNLETVIKALSEAHMKLSSEKSKYFYTETEFLGYVISHNAIKMDPQKLITIEEYPEPTTLRQLRSFLGLSGYYRKFVKNYSQLTRPMTQYLCGQNGQAKNANSKNIKIKFNDLAKEAFINVKNQLKEAISLNQPDYNKTFDLTTDASNDAIGAVLSQDNKPLTFISRVLSKTEARYATNEKEMLAIVWALKKLRNYLYGVKNIRIFTDHQPLTFALSDKNPNAKLRRWRSLIEEYAPEILYKPGKENVVADALSRQRLNALTGSDESNELTAKEIQQRKRHQLPCEFNRLFPVEEWHILDVEGDGNCLFHSFSEGLRRLHFEVTSSELRKQCLQEDSGGHLSMPDAWGNSDKDTKIISTLYGVDVYIIEIHEGVQNLEKIMTIFRTRGKETLQVGHLDNTHPYIIVINRGKNHFEPIIRIATDGNTIHSCDSSERREIKKIGTPINAFKCQIIIEHHNVTNKTNRIETFPGYWRTVLKYSNTDYLRIELQKNIDKPTVGIKCTEKTLCKITDVLLQSFPNATFIHTQVLVDDLTSPDEQLEMAEKAHNRAHRQTNEVIKQITETHWWPSIKNDVKTVNKECYTCKVMKYDRHPPKEIIGETPIPEEGGVILHADIFFIDGKKFLIVIDPHSKFLITSQLTELSEMRQRIYEITNLFPNVRTIITDNEKSLDTPLFEIPLKSLGTKHKMVPAGHSLSNGPVERVNSTLLELIRIIRQDSPEEPISIAMVKATRKYNESFHSVTDKKPIEVFHNLEQHRNDIIEKLKIAQQNMLKRNKNKQHVEYAEGEEIFIKENRRNKLTPRYKKRIVVKNNRHTVETKGEKNKKITLVHKNLIKTQ